MVATVLSTVPASRVSHSRPNVRCSASQNRSTADTQSSSAQPSRRSLLAIIPLVAVATVDRDASAAWDGESAAQGSCPLGAAGLECRQQLLLRDKKDLGSYEAAMDNSSKAGRAGAADKVSDKYTADTLALAEKLTLYLTIDPYSPERGPLIKTVKQEGLKWVGKYAKGGSVRSLSGRKFYIVIDSVLGHLASNGVGLYPPSKAKKLLKDLDDTKAFLAEGN